MRKRRKPLGWPSYMVARRLADGRVAYYWTPPTWARKRQCPVLGEALGVDYAAAKTRCDDVLNRQFEAWRTDGAAEPERDRKRPGTFDWMIAIFKAAPQYREKPPKTRRDYDAAARLAADFVLKDGRRFGALDLAAITPGAADRLLAKLKIVREPVRGDDGKPIIGNDGSPVMRERPRLRTAVAVMTVCRRAWFVAWRSKPRIVPEKNPFSKMGLAYAAKPTRAVGFDSLIKRVAAADAAGEPSVGTAALIAFFWLQRKTDILGRLSWSHYRPVDAPGVVRIWHHKTGALVDLPLYDDDEAQTPLWPELMARLDAAPRRGTLMVMRDTPDRRRKIHLPWSEYYFGHRARAIWTAAGLDPTETFMGLRHGGNTEGGDADLTDAQLRALSGHKTPHMTQLYTKRTMKQRRVAARKRLDARTKTGQMLK